LELARQLAERGDDVEAAARRPLESMSLRALADEWPARVRIHTCDITEDDSAGALVDSIGGVAVDVLINNAGVMGRAAPLDQVDLEEAARIFMVNALGALRVTRSLLPLLRAGKTRRLVHISSMMGSIGRSSSGGAYGYRMSKAALNMAAKTLAVDLRAEGFVSVAINPGWVQTDMGGAGAPLSPEESVRGMLRVIDGLGAEDSGTFLDYEGGRTPW
jgi:NAD(P)-dependent dehydrogenase (short-subunit alcohol dehydrogenase family)